MRNEKSKFNNIGINSEMDMPRIRHLMKIGLAAVSNIPATLARYLTVSDRRIFWSAILGLIGIPLECLCYFAVYRLIVQESEKYAHTYRTGILGCLIFGGCGVHVPCCAAVYFLKKMVGSVSGFLPDTDYNADKSLCQGFDAASEMGMYLFGFVRSANGRDIKDFQLAFDECPCDRVDQHRKYLDVRRTAFDDKKEQEVCRMKLLVYGAGVIGCELAHVLKKGGNDVTLLARGDWKDTLEKRGLVIRHYLQRKTTTDKVKVTGCLNPDDEYDIIFVVMQADQVPDVLPAVAANVSRYVVFIGNNPWAEKTETAVQAGFPVKKEAAFGFMGAGGRREGGQVISIHICTSLTIGGRDGELSYAFRDRILKAFSDSGCSLTWENRMDAWLKCHMAEILPIGYVSYAVGCSLPKASKAQRRAMVDATAEGFSLLKSLGYPIRPAEDEAYFKGGAKRMLWQAVMFVMCKTPLGRLAATDHCTHAVSEMSMLDRVWEELRTEAADASVNVSMPVWDSLRKSMPVKEKWGQHERIKNAYKSLGGKATFYDGMITCSTLPGKAVCKLVWNMDKKKNDRYLHLVFSGIPEGFSGRMLEAPVGTGVLTMPVYETLGNADITCLDYSPDMMERAKRQAEKRGLKNVRFMQGDVGKLSFPDESFDLVMSLNGFHAFSDKEAAYSEILRVLKPGGIFCGCFYVKGENKRTDWFIEKLYTPKGFFTPPYETVGSLRERLKSMYRKAEVKSVEGMAVFRCRK